MTKMHPIQARVCNAGQCSGVPILARECSAGKSAGVLVPTEKYKKFLTNNKPYTQNNQP